MKNLLACIALVLGLWATVAAAQQVIGQGKQFAEAKTTEAKAPAVLPASVELTPEEKLQVRNYQYELDQLEIEIQKAQVTIANNQAKQAQLNTQLNQYWFTLIQKYKLDITKYDFEVKQNHFVKKQGVQ